MVLVGSTGLESSDITCVLLNSGHFGNQNEAMKPLVIQTLEFHLTNLKGMADVNATMIMR